MHLHTFVHVSIVFAGGGEWVCYSDDREWVRLDSPKLQQLADYNESAVWYWARHNSIQGRAEQQYHDLPCPHPSPSPEPPRLP